MISRKVGEKEGFSCFKCRDQLTAPAKGREEDGEEDDARDGSASAGETAGGGHEGVDGSGDCLVLLTEGLPFDSSSRARACSSSSPWLCPPPST